MARTWLGAPHPLAASERHHCLGEVEHLAESERTARLKRRVEPRAVEIGSSRLTDAIERLALRRQRTGPGLLAQVGRRAEQSRSWLCIALRSRNLREVLEHHDRGPVIPQSPQRRQRDGEPAQCTGLVRFGQSEPAPHRCQMRDRLVEAVLERLRDALVDRRLRQREVAPRLGHAALPVERVCDPEPRLYYTPELDGLVSGSVAGNNVSFDLDRSDWHNSGVINGSSMSGAVTVHLTVSGTP